MPEPFPTSMIEFVTAETIMTQFDQSYTSARRQASGNIVVSRGVNSVKAATHFPEPADSLGMVSDSDSIAQIFVLRAR